MLTLLITTSTKLASLSLYENDAMIANININVKKTHSTYIVDELMSLFAFTNKELLDVKNVVISVGPGSFTGVRISSALIKGLFAEKKDINIYTVNELDALAYQGYNIYKDNLIAIIDSNKEKLYAGIYEKGKLVGERFKTNLDEVISLVFKNKYKLIGDAAITYRKKIEENGINLSLSDIFLRLNSCVFYDMLKEGILEKIDLLNLVPDYLEKSQAEKEKYGIK